MTLEAVRATGETAAQATAQDDFEAPEQTQSFRSTTIRYESGQLNVVAGSLASTTAIASLDDALNDQVSRPSPYRPPFSARRLQEPPAHTALSTTTREIARILFAVVMSKAFEARFPITRASLAVDEDPEEDTNRAVLRFITPVRAAQAMAFWDSLESDLQRWRGTMTSASRRNTLDTLELRFFWTRR